MTGAGESTAAGHGTAQAPAGAARARRALLLASVAVLPLTLGQATAQAPAPQTVPTGGRVVAGGASIASPSPGQLTITQTTQRAAIDWQGFSVGERGHVQFQQPNSAAVALNRVTGPEASVIAGRISANGQVAIVNQSGVVFTPTARVDVGALVASAAGISNENFMAGRMVFDQPPRPGARIINEGRITVAEGGLAALVAPEAANRGTIEARLGRVVIGGAETYALDLHGDGLLSLEVTRPTQHRGGPAAANTGTISAERGTVLITAEAAGQLVQSLVEAGGTVAAREGGRIAVAAPGGEARVAGTLDARSASGTGGEITVTGRQIIAAPTARLDASGAAGGGRVRVGGDVQGRGSLPRAERTAISAGAELRVDATAAGQGGSVVVWADQTAYVHGTLSARGGPRGGDGGFVETSGARALSLGGVVIDTAGPAGRAGTWLIDPVDLTISTATAGGTFNGSTFSPDNTISPATIAAGDISTALASTNVTLSAAAGTGDAQGIITVAAAVSWSSGNTLTLEATSNIIIDAPITAPAGRLVLIAGPAHAVTQTAPGAITAAQLAVTAPDGVSLAAAANAITTVTSLTSGGNVSLSSTVPLTFAGPVSAGSALTLSAPSLSAQALSVTPGGTVTLSADAFSLGGAVTATGGRVVLAPYTAGLDVSVGGAGGGAGLLVTDSILSRIATGSGTLQIGNGAGTGAITIVADTAIAAPSAGVLDLRAGGAITQGGRLSVPRLSASGASVTLTDAQNAIASLGASSASNGDLSITVKAPGDAALVVDGPLNADGALTLANVAGGLDLRRPIIAGGTVGLDAAGTISQTTAGVIVAPALTASVTGSGSAISLATASNAVASLAGATIGAGGGGLAFSTTTALAITGAVSVPGAASLSAGGAVSQSAAISAASLGVSAGADGLVLDNPANAFGTLTLATAAGGPVTVETGSTLAITGAVSGSVVRLESTGGAITTAAGGSITATAGTATITGATGVTLADAVGGSDGVTISAAAGNVETAAVTSSGGTIAIEGNAVTTGALAGATAVTVTARNGGDLVLTGAVSADAVTLSSTGGGIIGSAASPITAAAGTASLTASGGITLGATASGRDGITVRSTGGDVATAGLAASGGDVVAEGRAVSTGALSASGDITVTGTTAAAIGAGSAGGDVSATAPNLFVAGPLAAGAGRTLDLVADTFSATGTLSAPGGTVSFRPVTAGREISLGGAGPGLVLSGGTIALVSAGSGTLRVGAADAGAISLTGPVVLTGRAARLELLTAQGVFQAGRLEVQRLSVTAGGAIGLGLASNTIGTITRAEASGAVSIASTSALSVEGDVSGNGVTIASGDGLSLSAPVDAGTGTLALDITGAVTQTGTSPVTAGAITGRAGSLALATAANAVGTLGPFTAGADGISLATDGPLTLAGAIITPGTLSLSAQGTIGAGTGLAVTAARIAGSAAGGTDLGTTAHAVGNFGAWSDTTGGFSMRSTGPLAIAGDVSLGGGLSLTAGGAITQGAGTSITAAGLSGGAAGGTALASPANAIGSLGPWVDATGGLALATTGPLAIGGAVTLGGTLDLAASRITQGAAAAVTAPRVTATAANGINLDASGNAITAFGPVRAMGGDITLATAGPLLLDGAAEAGGRLSLSAGGTISQTAPVTAARLAAEATGGIALDDGANAVAALDDVRNTGTGSIRLRTTTGLAVDGRVFTPASLVLEAGGAITQGTGGAIEAASLSGRSDGGAILSRPANRVAALTGWTNTGSGGLSLVTGSALTVTGTVSAGNGALLVETRGAFPLTINTALSSDVSLTGLSGGTISLGDHRYAAPLIAFRARGASAPMTVTDGVFAASDSVVLAATGSMQFSGTTRVEPLSPGNRPAIVLSVRSADEQTDASRVRPDVAGLADLAQFTQIERFALPAGATRNSITLSSAGLIAPTSPLFLVIDAGAVTGRIDVARLGLITAGGSADLSGCVNGVCGPNAASLGRSTDPSSLARLNNCPVSSPNCLDFPTTVAFVSTAPRELPLLVTERRFEGVEITLSDVADEDQ